LSKEQLLAIKDDMKHINDYNSKVTAGHIIKIFVGADKKIQAVRLDPFLSNQTIDLSPLANIQTLQTVEYMNKSTTNPDEVYTVTPT